MAEVTKGQKMTLSQIQDLIEKLNNEASRRGVSTRVTAPSSTSNEVLYSTMKGVNDLRRTVASVYRHAGCTTVTCGTVRSDKTGTPTGWDGRDLSTTEINTGEKVLAKGNKAYASQYNLLLSDIEKMNAMCACNTFTCSCNGHTQTSCSSNKQCCQSVDKKEDYDTGPFLINPKKCPSNTPNQCVQTCPSYCDCESVKESTTSIYECVQHYCDCEDHCTCNAQSGCSCDFNTPCLCDEECKSHKACSCVGVACYDHRECTCNSVSCASHYTCGCDNVACTGHCKCESVSCSSNCVQNVTCTGNWVPCNTNACNNHYVSCSSNAEKVQKDCCEIVSVPCSCDKVCTEYRK